MRAIASRRTQYALLRSGVEASEDTRPADGRRPTQRLHTIGPLRLHHRVARSQRGLLAWARVRLGRLIAASVTTGWFDWVHGELWLLPDGIMRLALDLTQTHAHGFGRTVSQEPPTREFDDRQIHALVAAGPRNIWISADRIHRADLRSGLVTDRLKLSLKDGRSVKLLWRSSDGADGPLREALGSWGIDT